MKWLNKTIAYQYANGKVELASKEVLNDLNRFADLVSEKIHGLPLFEKPSDLVYHIQKLHMKEIGYGEILVNTERYPSVDITLTIYDKEMKSNVSTKLDLSVGYYNNAPDVQIHYYRNSSFYRKVINEELFDKMIHLNKFIEREIFGVWTRIIHSKKISGKINYSSYRHEFELHAFEYKFSDRDDFFKIKLEDVKSRSSSDLRDNLKHNVNMLINSKHLLKELNKLEEPIIKNSAFSKFFSNLEFVDSYRDSETIEWDVYSF